MELIVFDLDGTLLDSKSEVSSHTQETLRRLRDKGIAYTVATGRTLHAAQNLLDGHGFSLPHIYKNGVMTWRPQEDTFSHCALLTAEEVEDVLSAFAKTQVAPFIFTLENAAQHTVYHPADLNEAERKLITLFSRDRGLRVQDLNDLPDHVQITNISAMGEAHSIDSVAAHVAAESHLVAYAGTAIEGEGWHWIDVHHNDASKGGAIELLKRDLGVTRVICFGDSDNDLSMFAMADECYAPSNAKAEVLAAATEVIGHHDEDGVSQFLRERFDL